jgi:hypothetical protein
LKKERDGQHWNIEYLSLIAGKTAATPWLITFHSKAGRRFSTNTDPTTFGAGHGQEFRNTMSVRVFPPSLVVSCQPLVVGGNGDPCHQPRNEECSERRVPDDHPCTMIVAAIWALHLALGYCMETSTQSKNQH